MPDPREPLQAAGMAQVRVTAAEAETIERITDLISDRHPTTAPALCRADDALIEVSFYTNTRLPADPQTPDQPRSRHPADGDKPSG